MTIRTINSLIPAATVGLAVQPLSPVQASMGEATAGLGRDTWQARPAAKAGITAAAPIGGSAGGSLRAWVQPDYRNPDGLRRELTTILYRGVMQDIAGFSQYQTLVGMLNQYDGLQLESIRNLVNASYTGLEQVFILKALAAREPWENLVDYANQMRGQSESTIYSMSTMRDSQDLMQQWQDSCGPAVLQLLAGEANPRYAWELNRWQNPAQVDPYGAARGVASQQKEWLEEFGGKAVPRGQSGGRGIALDDMVNKYVSTMTGVRYSGYPVSSTSQALDHIARTLVQGYDVPIRVEGQNGGGHFMLLTGTRQGAYDREFRVHDTDTGRTRWVANSNFLRQQLPEFFAGWTRMSHYYSPVSRV